MGSDQTQGYCPKTTEVDLIYQTQKKTDKTKRVGSEVGSPHEKQTKQNESDPRLDQTPKSSQTKQNESDPRSDQTQKVPTKQNESDPRSDQTPKKSHKTKRVGSEVGSDTKKIPQNKMSRIRGRIRHKKNPTKQNESDPRSDQTQKKNPTKQNESDPRSDQTQKAPLSNARKRVGSEVTSDTKSIFVQSKKTSRKRGHIRHKQRHFPKQRVGSEVNDTDIQIPSHTNPQSKRVGSEVTSDTNSLFLQTKQTSRIRGSHQT